MVVFLFCCSLGDTDTTLMDIYRPTIVVSELVAANNAMRDGCVYRMNYYLSPDGNVRNHLRPERNGEHTWEGADDHAEAFRRKEFQQGEADTWNLVRYEFKQYPAGMRYLILQLAAQSVKLARCSVMALCKSNALEAEEAVQRRG